ncbi:unnamed protein product [Brassica oleracea var. botrytis]
MKGGVSSEAEPLTKKQKKVKTQNESEAAAAGKGSSEKEGSKDLELENKATLTTIVNTLDNISRKFEKFDSRLEAYEFDQNRPLVDQNTIDDRVKALLEERLKVLGVGKIPENNDNPSPPSADKSLSLASPVVQTQQKSVNSPALAATPGKVFGPKKNLAKEIDKESGVKRTLDEEFGSVAKATDLDSQPLNFVLISPAKATKDDKDAKVPAYGRGFRVWRIVKGEEADEKKKAVQADAAFKRKEKADAKKKAVAAKKKEAEGKKKEAELKKKQETELKKRKQAESKNKEVTPSGEDSVFANVTDEVVGGENEFAPESDVEDQEVIRSAVVREYWEKRVQLSPKGFAVTAVFSPLVFPYVGDDGTTCMGKNVTPSSVIYDPLAPVDPVLLEKLMQHIKAIPPKPPAPADKPEVLSADHEGDFYSILIHERPWPEKEYGWMFDNWYEDVDHLYGCLQTGRNHWIAYHVDLKKEKIDCYDPIFGEATPETPSKKKFSFRRRSKRYTPQNTQIGDCGVYSLKFVGCLALGVTFDGINDNNIQGLQMKMAAEILDEGGNIVMSSLLAN